MKKRHAVALLAIFIGAFSLRVFIALQSQTFEHEAYFSVQRLKELLDSKTPAHTDTLSYGGRPLIYPPLFFSAINTISAYSLAIPLLYLLVFLFFRIHKPYYVLAFIIVLGLMRYTHPIVMLLIVALLCY